MKKKVLIITTIVLIMIVIIAFVVIDREDINIDFRPIDEKTTFSKISTIENLKKYDGKRIEIYGFMSPLSPYGYSYVYIASSPYAVELFDNTDFNSIAVFTDNEQSVYYTNDIVKVVGTLEFEDFTDDAQLTYAYRLINSTITEADISELDSKLVPYYIVSKELVLDLLNGIFCRLDLAVNYEAYIADGTMQESDLKVIDVTDCDSILSKLKYHKNNADFTVLNGVVTNLKSIIEKVNVLIENKDYTKLANYITGFDTEYYKFEEWILKFSI